MPPIPFFIVDVFAEEKYAGNQLAVFTEAASLSSDGHAAARQRDALFGEHLSVVPRAARRRL